MKCEKRFPQFPTMVLPLTRSQRGMSEAVGSDAVLQGMSQAQLVGTVHKSVSLN